MKNISMDLDYIKYFSMDEEDIIIELRKLKELQVSSLVLPYEIFVNKDLKGFKDKMVKCLAKTEFELILRSQPVRNFYSSYLNDKHLEQSIIVQQQFIYNLREELVELGINSNLKIIFTGGVCKNDNISLYLDKAITFFKRLAQGVSKINVEILIELTQIDFRMGRLIGNKWQDMKVLCDNIKEENFGICWNMKSSRINAIEYGDLLIPDMSVLDRIKIATVSNTLAYENNAKSFNVEMQFEELKSLIMSQYKGAYHLEYIYSYIHESGVPYQNVYDSIEYLNYILTYYDNQNNKGKLEINLDYERMKRRYIRREFTRDVMVMLESNNYRFSRIEMSENDMRLTCDCNFNMKPDDKDKVILKINGYLFELDITLMFVRTRDTLYDYIFKIDSIDRDTRKKLCELIYLSDD